MIRYTQFKNIPDFLDEFRGKKVTGSTWGKFSYFIPNCIGRKKYNSVLGIDRFGKIVEVDNVTIQSWAKYRRIPEQQCIEIHDENNRLQAKAEKLEAKLGIAEETIKGNHNWTWYEWKQAKGETK